MNTYKITYSGNLRTSALHVDSAEMIQTDAPKDNEGLGESFSPTDLLCTALGSCILTIMAIAARKKGIELKRDERVMRFLTMKMDKDHIEYAEKRRNKLSKSA